MAELARKLNFKKDGVQQTAKAYSTTAEAGAEYIENKIDGVKCYVAVGDPADSRATVGKIKKSSTAAERAILNSGKPTYTEMSWTTPGTYTFTVPWGVTNISAVILGGGGGGGGGANGGSGGGGGAGYLIQQNITVVPTSTLVIVVGNGGAGGTGGGGTEGITPTNGYNGDASKIGDIIANGGSGGGAAKTSIFGGSGTGGTGGANGGTGNYNNGGNGGTVSNEYYGAAGTGGTSTTAGGNGGTGAGGGGGGISGGTGGSRGGNGGAGGAGFVFIAYGGDI